MSLNLSPDIEARLIAAAHANAASVEEFVQRMIKQSEQAKPQRFNPEEWVTEFGPGQMVSRKPGQLRFLMKL